MTTLSAFVEIEVVGAIKVIQTVEHVFAGMGMYNIQEDGKAKAMGGINKLL